MHEPASCRPRRSVTAIWAMAGCLLLAHVVTVQGASAAETPAQLEPFQPFLDKTWKALVDPEKGVFDVARWERMLGGQAIRMLHSVDDGAYGGETIVMWDREKKSLVYYYFTTAGFYTHGTMHFDDQGLLHSEEKVSGHQSGVSEVRASQQVLPDGRLRVQTRMLRNGEWEDRGEVFYSEDPKAEVVLP